MGTSKDNLIQRIDELEQEKKDSKEERVPHYYVGTNKNRNYQARYVVTDFECTYNIGTAVTYCLRSSRKHHTPVQDLYKAIAHLEFEIERLKENK